MSEAGMAELQADLRTWLDSAPGDHPTLGGRQWAERLDSILEREETPDEADQAAGALSEYFTWIDTPRPRGEDEAAEWISERDGLWENIVDEVAHLIDELADAEADAGLGTPEQGPVRKVWRRIGASPMDQLPTDMDIAITPRAKRAETFERIEATEPTYLVFTGSTVAEYLGLRAARVGIIRAIRERVELAGDAATILAPRTDPRWREVRNAMARAQHDAVPVRCREWS